jgi:predicted metal-binding membrane protein
MAEHQLAAQRGHQVTGRAIAVLTAVLGIAAVGWVITVRQMSPMAMGTQAQLGSFPFFIGLWVAMMAAMMLPGAAPVLLGRAEAGGIRAAPPFAASYLTVWALAGAVVYALYRPHGTLAAGVATVAAGIYELTPAKRYFRARCRQGIRSGWRYGLCCIGSSAGLMAMLVALGVMSLAWMAVITLLATGQKLLPPRAAVDVPIALAITALGVLIITAPSAVPGLMPAM